MTKTHFTTKDVQLCQTETKRKLFNFVIRDPEPEMPEGWDLFDPTGPGDYVMVRTDSMTNLDKLKTKYYFTAEQGEVLTHDWQKFDEDMSILDLSELPNDFLLYFERIDGSGHKSMVKKTERDKQLPNKTVKATKSAKSSSSSDPPKKKQKR